ncbi:lipid carrier--UDP-N-acetylgalactosaminyltransferase [Polaribacter filamentus]|uniref:Lipid carrier--UDP-N-acetylgalactosaminyltransferase n=1 Tax=Polaribacter filamentus TaxID=53483 RepID=A0A2S7KYW2_9FLAO|nr:sugar transferase [Polaribacter filamentus]PQB07817.1 lipid carrier--UDP-N-acetylgalactosaminyltransferase [Polaribacter filamentus]
MPRIIDILLSTLVLLILLPFFVPIVVILLLTGEHKVFYSQTRVGYKNQNFKILKFATMLSNSANMGPGSLTLKNDPRVLPFGSFLRKTKINELPQILNIIIGDLSIVGPRPQMQVDFEKYSDDVQKKIYNVRPGLTGIGSIIFRDEESLISAASESEDPHDFYKRVIAPYKGELEMWYQSYRSVFLDFQLIFITAWVIVAPETRLYEKWFKDLPKRSF